MIAPAWRSSLIETPSKPRRSRSRPWTISGSSAAGPLAPSAGIGRAGDHDQRDALIDRVPEGHQVDSRAPRAMRRSRSGRSRCSAPSARGQGSAWPSREPSPARARSANGIPSRETSSALSPKARNAITASGVAGTSSTGARSVLMPSAPQEGPRGLALQPGVVGVARPPEVIWRAQRWIVDEALDGAALLVGRDDAAVAGHRPRPPSGGHPVPPRSAPESSPVAGEDDHAGDLACLRPAQELGVRASPSVRTTSRWPASRAQASGSDPSHCAGMAASAGPAGSEAPPPAPTTAPTTAASPATPSEREPAPALDFAQPPLALAPQARALPSSRSTTTTSFHSPSSLPCRRCTPTSRQPSAANRRRLTSFEAKIFPTSLWRPRPPRRPPGPPAAHGRRRSRGRPGRRRRWPLRRLRNRRRGRSRDRPSRSRRPRPSARRPGPDARRRSGPPRRTAWAGWSRRWRRDRRCPRRGCGRSPRRRPAGGGAPRRSLRPAPPRLRLPTITATTVTR